MCRAERRGRGLIGGARCTGSRNVAVASDGAESGGRAGWEYGTVAPETKGNEGSALTLRSPRPLASGPSEDSINVGSTWPYLLDAENFQTTNVVMELKHLQTWLSRSSGILEPSISCAE